MDFPSRNVALSLLRGLGSRLYSCKPWKSDQGVISDDVLRSPVS
jgi:hypothetical protein